MSGELEMKSTWDKSVPRSAQGTMVTPEQLGVSGKLRREVWGGAESLQSPPIQAGHSMTVTGDGLV